MVYFRVHRSDSKINTTTTMPHTTTVKFRHFTWVNVHAPHRATLESLAQAHHFHPLDIQECLSPSHRTKLDIYPGYSFFVILFPYYHRPTRQIRAGEIDGFISRQFLITVDHGKVKGLGDVLQQFSANPQNVQQYTDESPERLLYDLLQQLYADTLPMLDHLIIDCDRLEETIFGKPAPYLNSDLLLVRRNITDFRQITQTHKNFLKKLTAMLKMSPLYVMKSTDVYFENLVDHTKENWDMLEALKERIEALQESHEAQLTLRLQHVMKTLTIISVLTFPLTLIAALFAIKPDGGMPFADHPAGFWIIATILAVVGAGMLAFFKRKRWL